jgi:hypothetical protein
MSISVSTEMYPSQRDTIKPLSMSRQEHRIMAALGRHGNRILNVNDDTLSRYYEYLKTELSFPFSAYYPEPAKPHDATHFSCLVLELLDPKEFFADEFDGIYCKTRKGKYEINLPLIELHVPQNSPNYQLIDDFWYWFWNWR